ncbi:helix-turn-helix domain-containing protein [Marivita sp. S6314]|uniref:helix-turn-helix domain-containing protein n=1 Tax=Marivita sp. S6314 TaxID=2926406 RepID=UPI001FF2FBAD|nr:helix-turn-helix domain-containing protein [Marivita sp. S6314]MCK0150424.1 helix-turn-helix domain-containing protein [Marivita sp. S6314]
MIHQNVEGSDKAQLPSIRYPKPPAHVEVYVNSLGYELCIEFLLAFGGADLYVPDKPRAGSELVKVIGPSGVERLAETRHLQQRRVPLASAWLARCFRARGMSQTVIARRLRRSEITIRGYLKEDRGDYGEKL